MIGLTGSVLDDYTLDVAAAVEVELLVTDTGRPRMIEGTIVAATPAVLVIETRTGARRRARIPWAAIAVIRDALTHHPGQ